MKSLLTATSILSLLTACQLGAPSGPSKTTAAVPPPKPESAPALTAEELKSRIVVPSETEPSPEDLRAKIVIPSEVETPASDLRARIVIPSEVAVESVDDLKSKIVVPSELPAPTANDLRSKIYVPSES